MYPKCDKKIVLLKKIMDEKQGVKTSMSKDNLWSRLEQRGRDDYDLNDSWFLYAVNLDDGDDNAEVKFARKDGNKWLTDNDVVGIVKYLDIQ